MATNNDLVASPGTSEVEGESSTIVITNEEQKKNQTSPAVVLKLRKPKTDKNIQWEEGTVDNEHMNKKKSKCCCIYNKPRLFDESSDESDSDDNDCPEHCRGHKKKCYHQQPHGEHSNDTKPNGPNDPAAP